MKCLTRDIEVNYPCSPACPLYGDCIASFSREAKRRVRTNADHIRAMSDEELSRHCNGCPPGKDYMTCEFVGACDACWLAWLQQPYKEGET